MSRHENVDRKLNNRNENSENKIVQKEKLLKEKVIIWDQFFSNEWAVMKNGGEAFKNTSPTTEKGRDRSLEIKPNKIPKKTEKIGGSFSMLNSGQAKRATIKKSSTITT